MNNNTYIQDPNYIVKLAGSVTPREIKGTANEIDVTNTTGLAGNSTVSIATNPILPGSEGTVFTTGTTGQRSGTPNSGELRFNTTTGLYEYYNGTSWTNLFPSGTTDDIDLIQTQTASSSTEIAFTGLTSSYFAYLIDVSYIIPAAGTAMLYMQYSSDNGSSYITSNYDYGIDYMNAIGLYVGALPTIVNTGQSQIYLMGFGFVSFEACLRILLVNPTASANTTMTYESFLKAGGGFGGREGYQFTGGAIHTSATAINAFRLYYSTGNIASGKISLYGMKAS